MAEDKNEGKLGALINTTKRRFYLGKGPDGKSKYLEPGQTRKDLTPAQVAALSKYPGVIDPAKFVAAGPGVDELVAKNKALEKKVADLQDQLAKAKADPKGKAGEK